MNNISSFSSLPSDIFRYIFNMLTVADLMKFDTSVTNGSLRNYYITTVVGYKINISSSRPVNCREICWLILKGIKVH
jgi:hypothetical protein